jgi:hypothetical protein
VVFKPPEQAVPIEYNGPEGNTEKLRKPLADQGGKAQGNMIVVPETFGAQGHAVGKDRGTPAQGFDGGYFFPGNSGYIPVRGIFRRGKSGGGGPFSAASKFKQGYKGQDSGKARSRFHLK